MRSEFRERVIRVSWILCVPFLFSACGANQEILNSGKGPQTPANVESPNTTIDQEIDAMRTAEFRYIWVLRRKDGGVLDAADKAVIRANTEGVNRRVLTDDAPCPKEQLTERGQEWEGSKDTAVPTCPRALIIGTNPLPFKENIDALFSYFAVADLSPEPMPKVIPTRPPDVNGNDSGKRKKL